MSSVGYKRFQAFCKANNIEINNELEGTELVLFNLNYDENSNDKLKLEFRFKNFISFDTVRKLKSFISSNRGKWDVSFVFSKAIHIAKKISYVLSIK
nr:hypothetical protein [Mycoplasmopsis bovis]